MIFAWEADPTPLDPAVTTGAHIYRATRLMYETLVNSDLTKPASEVSSPPLIPGLAERWEISNDRLTYTFHLRKDVKFHDGTTFNAEAVKLNWDRGFDDKSPVFNPQTKSLLNPTLKWVKEYRAVDDNTFAVTLKNPFASFLLHMSSESLGIISPEALKKHGNQNIGNNPTGTGPYRFVSREPGGKVDLERNKEYWGEQPYLDKVVIRPITEGGARAAALQAGEVDFIVVVPPDSTEALQKDSKLEVAFAGPPHIWFWMLNTRDTETKDKRVRQALNYAVNREGLVEDILGGTALPAGSPIPPGNPAYNRDAKGYTFDREKAKALLKEAGVPMPLKLKGFIPQSGSGMMVPVPMDEFIQSNLRDIGVEVEFEVMEWGSFISRARKGLQNGEAFLNTSWGSNDMYWLEEMFSSALHPPAGNVRTWYANAEVDKLLDQARGEGDQQKRIALYQQAEALVVDDAPWLFVCHDRAPKAFSKKVKGFVGAPSWYFDVTRLSLA
ncbi:MAG: ABC transporter substrate-binding protein [Chloroflexota bacterium]|nr:ABC transporter substrate-binding protein [Chloroflexota bacterium]